MATASGGSGDTKKLAALIAKLARIAKGDLARALVDASGDIARKQIAEEFSAGRDPSGAPWRPAVGKGGPPLVSSGRLRSSVVVAQSSDGITIRPGVPYAAVHQRGAIIRPKKSRFLRFRMPSGQFVTKSLVVIPQRKILPTDSISGPWRDALRAAAALAVKNFV